MTYRAVTSFSAADTIRGFFALATMLPLTATAQDYASDSVAGFYAGLGGGYSNVYSWDSDYDDDDDFNDTTDSGDGDFGYSLITGYRFNPYIAIEAAYVDSGTSDWDNEPSFIDGELYEVDADVDITSYQLSIVGILPFLNVWEVYARGGAAIWDGESNQVLNRQSDNQLSNRKIETDDVDFLFGAGAGWTLNRAWNFRAEYTVFRVDDDLLSLGSNEDAYSDMFTLQVLYHFGTRPRSKPLERPAKD